MSDIQDEEEKENKLKPKFIGVDWAARDTRYRENTAAMWEMLGQSTAAARMITGVDFKTIYNIPAQVAQEKTEDMILILAGNYEEAKGYADEVLGMPRGEWHYVIHYRDMLRFRNSSVHIIGSARARADFEAIQGLFIQGRHKILDLEADD